MYVKADHPLKYKSWNAENIMRAIVAVQSNKCSVSKASEIHPVQRSTLYGRISGKVIILMPNAT